jgi:hypothetical protein
MLTINRSIPPRIPRLLVVLTVSVIGAGCAGANARQLARETLTQTTEYENALRATSRTLAAYYQTGVVELGARLAVARQTELDARIHRAADDAVDRARVRGLVSQDFRAFVDEVVSADLAEVARSSAALEQMRQHRQALLDQLEAQEKRLKTIRMKLEVLQTSPGWRDRLTQLRPYLESARKLLEEDSARQGGTR